MMRAALLFVVVLASPLALQAVEQGTSANPIRKVVNMLQMMQKKVTAEGAKEKELYDKFMCYCKTSGGTLSAGIAAAETKIPRLGSDIEEAEQQKTQTAAALKQAQADREAANTAIKEATAIREKEAAAFAAEKAEDDANIGAINKAVAALEKGMAGFLQTSAAVALKKLVLAKQDLLDGESQEQLLSFLSGTQGEEYAPQSGQITGILKQMADEMSKGLSEATAAENASIQNYEELMAAKKKELAALQASIESKTQKIGELGVRIVEMKNDLSDSEDGLLEDKKFLADMSKNCKTKTGEFEANNKVRGEELLALADTIKLLNDDDALELFKKTLPGASSLVQLQESSASVRQRAFEAFEKVRVGSPDRARLNFISLALRGKKAGFEKVIAMVDNMVKTLKREQTDDDDKKEYCATQFDQADDQKKATERLISDTDNAIATTEEGIATTADEIELLEAGIKALDTSVAQATEQRKEENAAYKELMASNGAALEVLAFAKNRLNKFYSPKLYKPPAKVELARDDKIVSNFGFVQVSQHEQQEDADAPPPPPETAAAYSKKSEESGGVIAMVDMLVKDLDKEMTVAETTEKGSQADYETSMQDSAEKRAQDSKSLTDKGAAKADLEANLETHNNDKTSAVSSLGATLKFIASLHGECDWLVQYYDVRKEARAGEIDSLTKAKAVLSGADYSFVQTRRLRRASA